MIVGVGIDVVDLARFEESLRRTPALRERLFTPAEATAPAASLAARFAAKEAIAKALGAPAAWPGTTPRSCRRRPGGRASSSAARCSPQAEALGVRHVTSRCRTTPGSPRPSWSSRAEDLRALGYGDAMGFLDSVMMRRRAHRRSRCAATPRQVAAWDRACREQVGR